MKVNTYRIYDNTDYPWTGVPYLENYKAKHIAKAYKPTDWEVSFQKMTAEMAVELLQKCLYVFDQAFNFPANYTESIYDPKETITDCYKTHYISLSVGYGIDFLSGQEYWLVKTSFGFKWGENRYIRIKRNDKSFNYGITCSYAQPRFD